MFYVLLHKCLNDITCILHFSEGFSHKTKCTKVRVLSKYKYVLPKYIYNLYKPTEEEDGANEGV